MGSILTIYNVRTVNQKTQHVINWAVITLRAECFWSLIILNEGLAGCSKEPSPIQSAAASALYSMGQEQCTSKPKNPFLIKTSAGYMEKNCAEQNIENLSHIHCSACTFIFPYPALSVQCLLALMYFRQGRKAACKHLRVQKLLYMFSDLNPGSVHPKCSSWKGKGKKEKKEKQKKKRKKTALCCFIHHTFQNIQISSSSEGKSNKDNALALPVPAQLCGHVMFVYEAGAASRGAPAAPAAPGDPEKHLQRNHQLRTLRMHPSTLNKQDCVVLCCQHLSTCFSAWGLSKMKGKQRQPFKAQKKRGLLKAHMPKTKQNGKAALTIASVWFCRYRFPSIKINRRLF